MVLGFDDVLVDAEDLFASGWTEDLIRKFLGEEDERAQVAPRVRGGKRLWKIGRVASAEQSEEFRDAFAVSVARRSLTPRQVESFIEARRIARQTMSFLRARGRAVNHH
jgi:hypothetical protein